MNQEFQIPKMQKKLELKLKEIQSQLENNQLNLQKILDLQKEAKKAFDEKIEQFFIENDYLQKVEVPSTKLHLFNFKNKKIDIPINLRYLLSAPFIYGMIIPLLIFHIGLEIYHQVCFRLYGIPLVRPEEYFVYDRQLLSWLHPFEKMNCMYCSYANNLIRYASEIAGRTERYWCPIKYYRRISNHHSQYDKFIDSKDEKEFREDWEKLRSFKDLTN